MDMNLGKLQEIERNKEAGHAAVHGVAKSWKELSKNRQIANLQNNIRFRYTTYWASLVAQLVKNPPTMCETWVGSPGLGRSHGVGNGYQLQYSGLENFMDCIVHGVANSQTRLSYFHFQTT